MAELKTVLFIIILLMIIVGLVAVYVIPTAPDIVIEWWNWAAHHICDILWVDVEETIPKQ